MAKSALSYTYACDVNRSGLVAIKPRGVRARLGLAARGGIAPLHPRRSQHKPRWSASNSNLPRQFPHECRSQARSPTRAAADLARLDDVVHIEAARLQPSLDTR
jgi:hypothetical protein